MAKPKRAQPKRNAQQGRRAVAAEPATGAAARKGKAARDGAAAAGAAGTAAELHTLTDVAPPMGLQNLGNTCFFNSALQVLAAAPAVQQHFSGNGQLGQTAPLGSAMRELVQTAAGISTAAATAAPASAKRGGGGAAKRASANVYSPHRLLAAVRKIAPQFKGGGQQDSHELLRCLLAGLQAEEDKALKLAAEDARGNATTGADADAAAGQPAAAGEGHRKEDQQPEAPQPPASVIEQLFGGRLASTVVCGSCSHNSTQSERFMDLSLQIASVPAARSASAGDQDPGSGPVAAAAPKAAKPLSSKQRKAALKQERKTAKLARSRAARSGSGELAAEATITAKGRRMRSVPLTPADVVRHSPPGRGAIPPRPAIRSGSASSLASSDTSFSALAQQQTLNPSATGPMGSRLGSMSSFDGRASFGGGDSAGSGGGGGAGPSGGNGSAGAATQPHPPRLTMELMNSLSPPLGASPDDFEDDPFLRAMSRASTPPTSVISDADSTAAARYSSGPNSVPPSPHGSDCDGDGRSPTSGRTASSNGAAAPVPIPAAGPAAWHAATTASEAEHSSGSPASPAAGAAAELRLRGGGSSEPPQPLEAGGAAAAGGSRSASTSEGDAAGNTHAAAADGSVISSNSPKLLGGAEPGSAASSGAEVPVNGESEAALAAAAQAARRAAAEAEEAAGAIAAEAAARGEAPVDAKPQPQPPGQGRKAAAMERQNSFLDDSIQVAGAAATAEAAGFSSARPADSAAAADGAAAGSAAAGSSAAASQSSAFAATAQQPAPAGTPDVAAAADSGSDGEAMGALGDLFDESGVQGTVQGVAVDIVLSDDDFGCQDRTGPAANSGDTSLRDCLAAFFAPEDITYTCPAEAAAAGKAAAAAAAAAAAEDGKSAAAAPAAAGSARTGSAPQLALLGSAPSASSAASDASAARKVSWSDSPHVVVMIPGSEEQRGTDLRAACKGHEPFSRPMSYNGANLLVTAQMDQFRNDTLTLQIHPHDMELSTISLLDRTLDLTTVHIDRIQGFDDREEQARIQEGAQILMDCVADIVDNHGLGPLRLMCETMQLKRLSEEDADAAGGGAWQLPPVQYRVTGVMPDGVGKDGWKSWQYPSAAHPRRSSGSYGATAMRSTSLDTASSGSLDFVLSSSSGSDGSGGGKGGEVALEMSLPPALEHAAGLAHQTASGSRSRSEDSGEDGGGSGSSGDGNDSSHPVVVVDKRLYRSAPELADMDASAGGDAHQQPRDRSSETAATAAAPPPIGEAAASAVAAVDLEEAADAGDAAGAPAGWTDGKPPTGIARNRSPEGGDIAADAMRSKSPEGGDKEAGVPPGPAVKSYAVQHPPQLLTLHLKRFEQDKRGQFRKVSRRVRFDFQLDMSQWLAASGSGKQQPLARYQLVGIVEHSGTMRSGHYVAYVQRGPAAQRSAAPAAASAAGTVQPLPAAAMAVAAASALAQSTPDAAPDAAVPDMADADAGSSLEADGSMLPSAAAAATAQPATRPAPADGTSVEQPMAGGSGGGGGGGGAEVQPEQLAWFRVSDQHVKRVTWAQVAAAEAYLLLYARC